MNDFVDPTVIAQITKAKETLITEVAKIKPYVTTIGNYANSLGTPTLPEAPMDGKSYGRNDGAWVEITGDDDDGGGAWGTVTGIISDQTDLQQALDLKTNKIDISNVAKTGKYTDLVGLPTILPEAPEDSKQYVRKNGQWVKAVSTIPTNPILEGKLTHRTGVEDVEFAYNGGYNYEYSIGKKNFFGGYQWQTLFDDDGVYHIQNNNKRKLAFADEIPVITAPTTPNLSTKTTPTTVTINNSAGNNAIIPIVTTSKAGVMSATDKAKLDSTITDSPQDGKQYARKDGVWEEVASAGGGGGGVSQGIDYSLPVLDYTETVTPSNSNIAVPAATLNNWKNKQVMYMPNFTGSGSGISLQVRSTYITTWVAGDGFDLIIPYTEWKASPSIGAHSVKQIMVFSGTGIQPPYARIAYHTAANSAKIQTVTTPSTYTIQFRAINYKGVLQLVIANSYFN